MLTAFNTFRNHSIMADESIILPVDDQITVKGEGATFGLCHYPNWVTCLGLKYSCMLKFRGKPGSQRQKHVPLLFSHKTWKLKPWSWAPQSQRSWLFTFTSHPHSTFWSDCCWDGQTAVPTSLHVLSSQNTPPSGIHVLAEVNHLEDQSLTTNILLRTDEWLIGWKS